MKKRTVILTVVFSVILILLIPIVTIICGFGTPAVFSQTYYGELAEMYGRIKNCQGKKIIILGNSSVAFGVDSGLIENELRVDKLDYTVCNFGLYGAIGTKAMLDLSEKYVDDGDVVIFTPELDSQSLSLYFSGKEFFYAADSDFSLLSHVKSENVGSLVGAFSSYTSEKMSYIKAGKVASSGTLYSRASFDNRCDMIAERNHNIMTDGHDVNNPIMIDENMLGDDFVDYLNSYYKKITAKGATMYYSFAPMNKRALPENYSEKLDAFADAVTDKLDFVILGSPHDYVLDYEWFYDSDVHLNSSGMTVRSIRLTNDLKMAFGLTSPVLSLMPDKPEIPVDDEKGDGEVNNDFVDFFDYEETPDGFYLIVGLKENGASLAEITVPYSYNGTKIIGFSAETFAGNTSVKEIAVQSNIKLLRDGSFSGCSALEKLIVLNRDPESVAVGYSLLDGAANCTIYVSKDCFSEYSNDYYWGHYAGHYKTF